MVARTTTLKEASFFVLTLIRDFGIFPMQRYKLMGSLPGYMSVVVWQIRANPTAQMFRKKIQNSSCIAVGFLDLKTKMYRMMIVKSTTRIKVRTMTFLVKYSN